MDRKTQNRLAVRTRLIRLICRMGHPEEFASLIADSLGTEMTMKRMNSYLLKSGAQTAEQIADEMLAIVSDRERWAEKKKNEYYNQKYNQMRCTVLGMEDEE